MKKTPISRHSVLRNVLALFTLIALHSSNLDAAPHYELEACCSLCPEAYDDASYNTEFLKVSQQLVEGTDGWLYRSKLDLDEQFEIDQHTLNEMSRFRAALAARGTKLLMVYQPTRGLINPSGVIDNQSKSYDFIAASTSYNQALEQIRSTGIIVPKLEMLIDHGDTPEFYFRRDAHWTPRGAMLTAQVVADSVSNLDLYSSIQEKTFTNARVGL